MQYYKPLQREKDKRWDYTVTWDKQTRPVGYCRSWREWADIDQKMAPDEYATARANQHKYHDDGHDTLEAACECYKQYMLDQRLQLMMEHIGTQYKCLVCGTWTGLFARVGGYHSIVLCEEHNNREEVEKLYEVGESMES